jgi:ferredoxin-NADP reductase
VTAPTTHSPHVETIQRTHLTATIISEEFEADVTVAEKHTVSEGVVTLTLQPVNDHPLPGWTAGAHVDLILDKAPTRQYSLCGPLDDHSSYRVGVLRDPNGRGSSLFVHDELQVGDVVRIRGPRNNFALVESPRYLFIAGGIGITPILAMIAKAEAAGADWRLVYGGRQRSSMAFLDELAVYGDRVTISPQEETGLLDLAALLGTPEADTLVYCCGPEPLLAAVEANCASWPTGSLHLERFAPKVMTEPVRTDSFEVVLEQSGLTLTVPPERSILDVVEEAGITVLSSCGEGTCGTCEVPLLEGEADHRDSVLTEEEQQEQTCLMVCVSRACTARLVLDL